jgi:hypothetical protein
MIGDDEQRALRRRRADHLDAHAEQRTNHPVK